MSVEREVQTPTGISEKLRKDLTKQEIRALAIEVLDRGITNSRIDVRGIIPPDLHYEWIHKDDIDEYTSKGFTVDTVYGKARGLHNDGTGRTQTGDAVLVTCPLVWKEAIEEAKRERYIRTHGDKPVNRAIAEEAEFLANASKVSSSYVKLTNASETKSVSLEEIKKNISTE